MSIVQKIQALTADKSQRYGLYNRKNLALPGNVFEYDRQTLALLMRIERNYRRNDTT